MLSQRSSRPVAARRCLPTQRSTAAIRSAKASFSTVAPARITCGAKSVAPCVEPAWRQARRRASLLSQAAEHCYRTLCLRQLHRAGTCSHHVRSEERGAVCRASAPVGPSPRVAACQSCEHCRRTQWRSQLHKASTCSRHAPREERSAVCRANAATGPSLRVAACQRSGALPPYAVPNVSQLHQAGTCSLHVPREEHSAVCRARSAAGSSPRVAACSNHALSEERSAVCRASAAAGPSPRITARQSSGA